MSATPPLAQTQPPSYALIEPPHGGALAPSKNIRTSKRKPSQEPLEGFLASIATRIHQENYSEELRRARKWLRNHETYNGNHYGVWNSTAGMYRTLDPSIDDCLTVDNLYGYFVRTIVKEAVRSNVTLEVNPTDLSFEAQGGARVGDSVLKSWFRRYWTADEVEREVKLALLCGNYYRKLKWHQNIGAPTKVPQIGNVQLPGDGFYACPTCEFAMPGSELPSSGLQAGIHPQTGLLHPQCPECQSSLLYGEVQPMNEQTIVGEQTVPGGDPIPEVIDPLEMKGHLHARRITDSPYLRRRRLVLRDVVEQYYDWWDGPGGSPEGDIVLYYQRALEAGVGATGFIGNSGFVKDSVVFEETWVQPALYSQYTLPKDFESLSGIDLPGGTDLIEHFPTGCCFVRAGDTVLDIYPSDFRDEWIHGVYDVVPTRLYGNGADDAVQLNTQLNEVNNLTFEILMHFATPTDVVNPLKVYKEDITGNPRQALIRLKNATGDDTIAKYFQRHQGESPPAALFSFKQELMRDMTSIFGAFPSLSGDSAASSGDTATRTAIMRDQAVSMLAPYLSRKGAADVRMAQIVLRMYQQHWTGKRFVKGDYDDFEGQYFEAADIQGDYEITAKPGSFAPRSSAELRQDMNEAGMWGQLPGGLFNPAVPNDVRKLGLQRLGIDYATDPTTPDFRKQRLEIKGLTDMWPEIVQTHAEQGMQIEQMLDVPISMDVDPQTGQVTPVLFKTVLAQELLPVDLLVDDHKVHAETVRAYLKTDKGLESPQAVHDLLEEHIKQHIAADTQLQQMESQASVIGQAPAQQAAMVQAARQAQIAASAKGDSQPSGKRSQRGAPSSQKMQAGLPKNAGSKPAGSQPAAK